ncbi:MAG: 30S ribosomal protein S20 [Candidatus Falkowbacteria bacterium]|nr:30S ribosomal protein S20 [Candidatus Falkowbacteria bacterium]
MPNTKSGTKELRKANRRNTRNEDAKDQLALILKRVRKAIAEGNEATAKEALKIALKELDKAARKGLLKKNTRDRKKSRLSIAVNKIKK